MVRFSQWNINSMGFYAAPLFNVVNGKSKGGYTPPAPLTINKTLKSTGPYKYKTPEFNKVNGQLKGGYALPTNPLALRNTLYRPLAEDKPPGSLIEVEGFSALKVSELTYIKRKREYIDLDAVEFEATLFGEASVRLKARTIQLGSEYIESFTTTVLSDTGYVPLPYTSNATLQGRNSHLKVGIATIEGRNKNIFPKGFATEYDSEPNIFYASTRIYPEGFLSQEFGDHEFRDTAVHVEGIESTLEYGEPSISNYLQFIQVDEGVYSDKYGNAYVEGGSQLVSCDEGWLSEEFGNSSLNSDQYLDPIGFDAQLIGDTNVSPQITYAFQFVATLFGNALVQRNPSPNGFIASEFGTQWISHSPRYLNAQGFNTFGGAYPSVFDPTQTIYQQLTPITSTVFGDIRAYNQNAFIRVESFNAHEPGVWGAVESNRRTVVAKSNVDTLFGDSQVQNKTPNLTPESFTSEIGYPAIGYSIRYVYTPGFDQYGLGKPLFTQTPSIAFIGINATVFGDSIVTHRVRSVEVGGISSSEYGDQTVWHNRRNLKAFSIGFDEDGIELVKFGQPLIEFNYREVLAQGSDHYVLGEPYIGFRVQQVIVAPYDDPKFSNHLVGGTQHLLPNGYDASQFGSRIIPEVQNLYPVSMAEQFGLPETKLNTRYIDFMGFSSENMLPFGRWGQAKIWNTRQYVTMYYDPDSLLNEPKNNSKWTAIENRSRQVTTFGQAHHAMGRPGIENKATPLYPQSQTMDQYGSAMIAYRIRHLLTAPIEPEYMSSWSVIHNDARVIAPASFSHGAIGKPEFKNTRRYFDFQGFDHSEFGHPMISDRIREITIENRHTISPPYINLPKVELSTLYLEPTPINQERFGSADFTIYQARIITGWAHMDRVGSPEIRNLTPELRFWGRPSDEFGEPYLRLSKAYYNHIGNDTSLIPKPLIEFKNRSIFTSGFNNAFVGADLNIIKTGTAPYGVQYIWLDSLEDNDTGYGIGIPGSNYPGGDDSSDVQVPKPVFNQWYIRHDSFTDMAKYGTPTVSANSIRVEPGIQEFAIGEHTVGLRHRTMQVSSIESTVKLGKPGLSPQTIWAPAEAPEQAVSNHEGTGPGGYVNIDGIVMGRPTISQYHGRIAIEGDVHSRISEPAISLLKVYIHIDGINSLRFGWHELPEWEHTVESSSIGDQLIFGGSEIGHRWEGSLQNISPKGMYSFETEYSQIDNLHRVVEPEGFESIEFGESVSGDFEYYPQSLHIGFKKPVIPTGTETTEHGLTWISHKVRQVEVQGFDNFISTYTTSKFKDRIQVKLKTKPQAVLSQTVAAEGFDSSVLDWQNIKLKVHYIRPDGNSDQFRMGGIQ